MKENNQYPTKSEFAKSSHNENSLATTRRRSSIVSLFAKGPRKSPDLKKETKANKPSGPRKLTVNNLTVPGKIELNTPSIAEVEENESILSCDHLLAQYPDYILLNTLRDGEHFGEIALSFQSLR